MGPFLRWYVRTLLAVAMLAVAPRGHAESLALLDLLRRHPSVLSGVTVLEIELDGGTEWLLTTDLPYARRYLADVGGTEIAVRNLADVVDTDVPGGRLITATVASAGDYRLSVRRVDVASPKGVAPLRPSFTGRPPTSSPPPPSADHHWLKSLPGDH